MMSVLDDIGVVPDRSVDRPTDSPMPREPVTTAVLPEKTVIAVNDYDEIESTWDRCGWERICGHYRRWAYIRSMGANAVGAC